MIEFKEYVKVELDRAKDKFKDDGDSSHDGYIYERGYIQALEDLINNGEIK